MIKKLAKKAGYALETALHEFCMRASRYRWRTEDGKVYRWSLATIRDCIDRPVRFSRKPSDNTVWIPFLLVNGSIEVMGALPNDITVTGIGFDFGTKEVIISYVRNKK